MYNMEIFEVAQDMVIVKKHGSIIIGVKALRFSLI